MKVKELITRLLDEPMDAEVCLQDPTEHISNGIMCRGYLFDITYIEPWNKHRICINFKDWRKGKESEQMGGKYSVIARNLNDLAWQYDWYGDSIIKFIGKSIYALTYYEVVEMGKHGY